MAVCLIERSLSLDFVVNNKTNAPCSVGNVKPANDVQQTASQSGSMSGQRQRAETRRLSNGSDTHHSQDI